MNRWERAWFRLWLDRPATTRPPRPILTYWFIAAPIRALAWYLTRK